MQNVTETRTKKAPAKKTVTGNTSKVSKKKTTKATASSSEPPKVARKRKGKVADKATAMPFISEQQRREMIATAAYFLAEKRGFTYGDPVSDWLIAESEVNNMLI